MPKTFDTVGGTVTLELVGTAWPQRVVSIGGPLLLWVIALALAAFRSPAALVAAVPALFLTIPACLTRFPESVELDESDASLVARFRTSSRRIPVAQLRGPSEVRTPLSDSVWVSFGKAGSPVSCRMTVAREDAARFIQAVAYARSRVSSSG
jgi:hypothetical protein